MLDALDGQVAEIVEVQPDQSASHRGHFEIDQSRCSELFTAQPLPNAVLERAVVGRVGRCLWLMR